MSCLGGVQLATHSACHPDSARQSEPPADLLEGILPREGVSPLRAGAAPAWSCTSVHTPDALRLSIPSEGLCC